jgi:lysophospholipase L1-like esterase
MSETEESEETLSVLLLGSSIIINWKPFLPQSHLPLDVVNLGKHALTTNQILEMNYTLKDRFEPQVVFFYCDEIGIEENRSVKEVIENTQQILEKIQDDYSMALVVYLSILKCPGRDDFSIQIEQINESIRNFSKKSRSGKKGASRIQFMDLNRVLRGIPVFFQEDGIHLNSDGYDKLNLLLAKQLF